MTIQFMGGACCSEAFRQSGRYLVYTERTVLLDEIPGGKEGLLYPRVAGLVPEGRQNGQYVDLGVVLRVRAAFGINLG
jgi:hypothetical protein